MVRFAFTDRDLDRLVSIRHVDDAASGRVTDELGMRLDRTTTVPCSGQPVVVSALDRDDQRRDARPPTVRP